MTQLRIRDAAGLLGTSEDTLRRAIRGGALRAHRDDAGRTVVAGSDLAAYARVRAGEAPDPLGTATSARNRFAGLVTAIHRDRVMAQVDLQCGPFRFVSLMSTEAVDELGLEPGSVAVAVVKATTVIVDVPGGTAA